MPIVHRRILSTSPSSITETLFDRPSSHNSLTRDIMVQALEAGTQFEPTLAENEVVVADFFATWYVFHYS